MLRLVQAVLVLSLVVFAQLRCQAAHDPGTLGAPQSGIEILVVEADGCTYCRVFRRDVLPIYTASERAKRVPIRFADINDVETSGLSVLAPVATVPTTLVLKDNKEIGRVSGYVGSSNFFHMINRLLSGRE